MQAFQRWLQEHFYQILMLMLAGGFGVLLAELLLTQHTDGIQLVAVGASVAGLLLTLAALFVRGRAATAVAVLLVLLSVTGVIGTFEHLEESEGERAEVQRFASLSNQQVRFVLDEDDDEDGAQNGEEQEQEGGEGTPPPLAPLSLAGLSLMGALTVVGASRRE